jgi:plastocyanin
VTRTSLAVLLCLLAAACGGEAGGLPAPRSHLVEIRGFGFTPARLAVLEGDTVIWRNADILPHTATSGSAWDSGSIASGGEWRWVATRGEFPYLCAFHPTMRGEISVAPRE